MPASMASRGSSPCRSAYSRTSAEIRIEQNFGPHIEQKWAVFAGSAGSVSSWYSRAVSGSSDSANWSCQRNSKRALRQRVVALLRPRMLLGEVGGVRGDLVGDHPGLHVVPVRQAEVFLGRDVAEHRGAGLRDHGRADRGGDVVVGRRDVGGQRAEGVERRLLAQLLLEPHVLHDLVHRDVPGALDHHLHAMGFRDLGELAEGAQLGELGLVVGVRDGPGPQPVAERERDVVARAGSRRARRSGCTGTTPGGAPGTTRP